MFDRLTREETDRAELISHNEGLAVSGELAIEWVITDVPIDRVDTILTELLDDLLPLDIPQDESSTVTARHQKLLKNGMRGQDPRVFLQLMSTGSRQIVVKRLVDSVPDFYAAHLLFEFICMHASIIMAYILNLGSD